MALASGTRFGSHEIVDLLGAGGMGEVYRATDTRLNRDVALKALPDSVATDPDRVARFKREAQVLASLNHPNVAAIYGLEESAAGRALVMELVEGPTLAERLAQGSLAIEEVISIAKQIAEAIEYAHDQGIVHRDLKPANIKITPSGTVKVLDFGLAKALVDDPRSQLQANSPTLSLAATQAGLILGTAAYMSPEQAKGKPADRRADIWSFGIVVFEMLAGRSVYSGETVSETMAAVIMKDPDWTSLPATTPPRLQELLRRCLVKDPRSRLQAIGEARIALEQGLQDPPRPAATIAPPVPGKSRSSGLTAAVAATSLVLGALAAGYAAWTLKPEPPRAVSRFAVPLPEGQQFTNTGRQFVVLSPDGTNLLYVANQRLYLRSMSDLEARAIAGTDTGGGATNPVFSPDGQTIVFYSNLDRALKRVAITGGAAITICAATAPFGMSWDEHGIVFGQEGKGIVRVSANGGQPEVIAAVDSGQMATTPQMLPGGRAVLFSVKNTSDTWDKARVVVQSLDGSGRKTLVDGGADGRYLPTGHLVYGLAGSLLALPFDLASLSVVGGPVPIIEGVRRAGTNPGATGTAQFSVSRTGSLAFVPGPPQVSSSAGANLYLALFDRKSAAQPLKLPPGPYRSPRVSPDGKYVAFESDDDKEAIVWVYDLAGGSAMRRLTFGGKNRHPMWSPDGQWVAFQSDREGDLAIFRQRGDGSGTAERLTKPDAKAAHVPQSWSPDGAHLLFSVFNDQWTLWLMTLKDRQTKRFGDVQSIALLEGVFSPDGRWIAYQTRESGTPSNQVFVQPFPPTGAKYLVREGGHPYWSPKGNELILNVGPGRSVVIPFTATPRVVFGQEADLPRTGRGEPNPSISRRNVDSMPDGEHIIGVATSQAAGAELAPQIVVVLNWHEELKRLVPTR